MPENQPATYKICCMCKYILMMFFGKVQTFPVCHDQKVLLRKQADVCGMMRRKIYSKSNLKCFPLGKPLRNTVICIIFNRVAEEC